jgi:uncharacterized membrane protein
MQLWQVFKYIHILAVITAVGANATYQFWYSRAGRDKERLVWVIESVRQLDRRVANPAYLVLLVAGIGIVLTGPFTFQAFWVSSAIVLYIVVAALGGALYAPAIRRQLAAAEADPTSPEYDRATRQSRLLGGLVLLIVLLIVALMVFKPTP